MRRSSQAASTDAIGCLLFSVEAGGLLPQNPATWFQPAGTSLTFAKQVVETDKQPKKKKKSQLADPLYQIHAFGWVYCHNTTLILNTKDNSPTGAQSCQGYCIIIFWYTHTNGDTTALTKAAVTFLVMIELCRPARLQYDYLQT